MAAVSLDDGLDQRQAQAQASSGPAGIGPIQPVPYVRYVDGIDAHTGVAHGERDEPILRAGSDVDMTVASCVLDGVLDQIREHLT